MERSAIRRIPMLATFQYGAQDDGGADFCTTRIPFAGESPNFEAAVNVLYKPAVTFGFVIRTPD